MEEKDLFDKTVDKLHKINKKGRESKWLKNTFRLDIQYIDSVDGERQYYIHAGYGLRIIYF